MSEYDVVVVGLGALGSAAAWQLARRGRRVLGLERFSLGHSHGASHGESRIIRLSYHTPSYVRSAVAAYNFWQELEAESGRRLIIRTGGVDLFPPGAAIDIADYTDSLTEVGIPFELWDDIPLLTRYPRLSTPPGTTSLYQPDTGIVAAETVLTALHDRARAHGAVLRDRVTVTGVHEDGQGVTVTTDAGDRYHANHAVVAVDGWTNTVLAGELPEDLPLTTTQEYVAHYSVEPGTHEPQHFPVWIWMDDPSFYGFPSFGESSVKLGQDCGGHPVDPDRPNPVDESYLARLETFARDLIPGVGARTRVTRCFYTLPPDRDFVLGPAPGHDRLMLALGAAHGFKFTPWFGAALADLVTEGGTDLEIEAFAADRPALTDAALAGETRWLV